MQAQTALFRAQAIRSRTEGSDDSPPLLHSRGVPLLALLLILTAMVLLVAMSRLSYLETASARGIVEYDHGREEIAATQAARIEQLMVTTGDTVTAGQVLAILVSEQFDRFGQDATELDLRRLQLQKRLLLKQRQQEATARQLRRAALSERQSALLNLQASARVELELLQTQLDLSHDELQAVERLYRQGAVAQATWRRARLQYLDLERRGQALATGLQQRDLESISLRAEIEAQDLAEQEFLLRWQQQLLAIDRQHQHTEAERWQSLVASSSGVVTTVAISSGEHVRAGQILFYLQQPGQRLQATVYAPSRVAARLAPGQELLMSFDAFDQRRYGRYPASIESIGRTPLDPRQHLLPLTAITEPVFKIEASLAQHFVSGPDVFPLQPGAGFTADFVFGHKTLLQRLLQSFTSMQGKLTW